MDERVKLPSISNILFDIAPEKSVPRTTLDPPSKANSFRSRSRDHSLTYSKTKPTNDSKMETFSCLFGKSCQS